MTDNDIIKALELCIDDECRCGECPYFGIASDGVSCGKEHGIDMLNLINRQKAEIERLRYNLKAVLDERADHSEAIKEFAKRLNENCYRNGYGEGIIFDYEIDNLVKEMTEDQK
jgi:hypothetical protein